MSLPQDIDLNGEARAGSVVEVFDGHDRIVGTTKADDKGCWCIRGVTFLPGEHTVHAVATAPHGSVYHSPALPLTIEAAADDDQLTQSREVDERRERAESRYINLVVAVVRGEAIEQEYADLVVAAAA